MVNQMNRNTDVHLQQRQTRRDSLGRLVTFETGADEGGREVIIVVHQADVSRGEADRQQRFVAVH